MKIPKHIFVSTLAEHAAKKLDPTFNSRNQLSTVVACLTPLIVSYYPMLIKAGIMVEDEVDTSILKEKTNQFFKTVPILKFPIPGSEIQITKVDVDHFIKDLEKKAPIDSETVIYLPSH